MCSLSVAEDQNGASFRISDAKHGEWKIGTENNWILMRKTELLRFFFGPLTKWRFSIKKLKFRAEGFGRREDLQSS